jgi:hypothetical protein
MTLEAPEKTQSSETEDNISFKFPEGTQYSVSGPLGLRDAIDNVRKIIHRETGVKFSRNEFILKALRHYMQTLANHKTVQDAVKEMEANKEKPAIPG